MRCILLGCLAITICACHAATGIRSGAEQTTADPQRRNSSLSRDSVLVNQSLEGVYFGTSDNQLGRRAWLLRLDSRTGRGSLYMPPNNLELSHVEMSSTGRLTFRSEVGLGDVTYSFDGQVTSSGITGTFHITRAQPSANEEIGSVPVTLRKLDAQLLNERQTANIGGLYSNVEYNEEGGDLIGAELILIPNGEEITGIFTSYENEMLPYAAVNITRSRNTVQFRTHTESGEESYQGTLSRERITLRHDSVNADSEAEPMVLFKRRSLPDILARAEAR